MSDSLTHVRISAANARLEFNGCDPDYIRDVCHGACCRSKSAPGGALVAVSERQRPLVEEQGAAVADGLIVPVGGRCPFQGDNFLCRIHGTPAKPHGCISSPFALNRRGTLIVRNRYKLLRCYRAGPRLPAYVAFRASLDMLFGPEEAESICRHLDGGGGDCLGKMLTDHFNMLAGNARTHRAALGKP